MNTCQVDLIIIGDSKQGNKALKELASYKKSIKVAFISREFKQATTFDFLNVEYICQEVLFIDYKNRLFGCHLANGDRVYSTHIIIASGLKYEPLKVNHKVVPGVLNTLAELPKHSKDLPAIVIGNNKEDAKFALEAAKKFKQVYFCTKEFEIDNLTANTKEKLQNTKNLLSLPNTLINKVTTENGQLKTVELTNYSTVTCSAICIKTKATPEVSFVPNNLIKRTINNFLETDNKCESTIVPKLFTIGTCCAKCTKQMFINMINSIKKDFEEVV